MSAVTVNTPYPTFLDIDGQPLEDGYVWIGVTGLEPQANPQTAYWDAALTLTVTQPVRTRGGYPLNGTAIGRLYTGSPYSIKVQNKNSSTLVLDLTGAAGSGVGSISFGTTGLTPAVPTDGDVVVAGTLAVANGGTGVTTATGTGSVVRATSPTVTGPTVSTGNLAFSGTAQRITGDMSNATVANRLAFQTSTVNANTSVAAIPNGTSVQSNLRAFNNSDPTNASFADIGIDTTIGAFVRADRTGSGTYLPLTFYTGGVARLTLSSTGAITSSDLADAVGYKGTPLNEQSAAYTLVIGDMGKSIVHPISDNNARTFTIPANGTVAYPVGTTITFINLINTVTIAITTDTMYLAGAGTTGSRTLAAYGMATAVKMTSTSWIISGNNLT